MSTSTLHDVLAVAGIAYAAGHQPGRNILTGPGGEPLGSYAAHEAWAVIRGARTGDLVAAFRAAVAQKAAA